MRILSFDLETTGIDIETDRIVSYALAVMEPGKLLRVRADIVNSGVEIPEGAANVHGISTEKAAVYGISPKEALERIRDVLKARLPLVVFNAKYDLSLLMREFQRHEIEGGIEVVEKQMVIDPLVLDRGLERFRKGSRKLEAVCEHYGITLENAHDAEADATAAGYLTFQMMEKYPDRFKDFALLYEEQAKWAFAQAKSLQRYFEEQGKREHVPTEWPYIPLQ